MVKPFTVEKLGSDLLIKMDDGTRFRALERAGGSWVVGDNTTPPDPPPPVDGDYFIWPFRPGIWPAGDVTPGAGEFGPRNGRLHAGIDFGYGPPNTPGTPIPASAIGKVILARMNGGYGNCVILDHGSGLHTLYGHMDAAPYVSVGEWVAKGQILGGTGNTGNSFGTHLHFETHEDGYRGNASARNPREFIPKWNAIIGS